MCVQIGDAFDKHKCTAPAFERHSVDHSHRQSIVAFHQHALLFKKSLSLWLLRHREFNFDEHVSNTDDSVVQQRHWCVHIENITRGVAILEAMEDARSLFT